jgi:16S rRNA (guanine527-N7)-methyltransferase
MNRADRNQTMDSVPREASPALHAYVDLLRRWNRSINLIGRADMPHVWQRHIADSLQLASLWGEQPARAIDLGSGAGFPGLVLSIAHGVPFDLVEQDQAKAAFLREAARVTGAPVRVFAERIEQAQLPPAPLVTARALAPLPVLLDYAELMLLPDGVCWFLKGRDVDAEIAAAQAGWTMALTRFPSRTGDGGAVLRIAELRRK